MKVLLLLTFLLACRVLNIPGQSFKSAIVITNTDATKALEEQYQYIKHYYPHFQPVARKIRPEGDKYYDIFVLRSATEQILIYFDITAYRKSLLKE